MDMDIVRLAEGCANVITETQFCEQYTREAALEKDVYRALREYLGRELNIGDNERELDKIIIAHGETREEKKRWSNTKVWQDVTIAGSRNTADIVIHFSDQEKIAIQLKYAKSRITSAIQSVVGQCIIHSLIFPAVIGVVISKEKIQCLADDKLPFLASILKEKNIFLVVK